MRCTVCGKSKNKVILNGVKYPANERVVYLYCYNCSNVYLAQVYEKNKHMYVYKKHEEQDLKAQSAQQAFRARKMMQFISKYMPDIHNGNARKVLDIGSNTSAFLQAYKEHGWDVYGVEPDIKASEYGRREYGILVHRDFYSPELFSENYFDFIFSLHVIEHCYKPFEFLLAANRHLKKGGILHLETPNILHTESSQIGWGHLSLFFPAMLRQLTERAGFEVIELHKRKLFPEHTLSMGVVGRKMCDVSETEPYLCVDKGFRKKSFLSLKAVLNFEFFCGLPRKNMLLKIFDPRKIITRGSQLVRHINESKK